MTTYQIGTPKGYMGAKFEADSDGEAVIIAESAPYYEKVLDLVDWPGERRGEEVTLLVVADEE